MVRMLKKCDRIGSRCQFTCWT